MYISIFPFFFLFVEYELNQILYQRKMDAPNFPNPFTANISAYFSGNG